MSAPPLPDFGEPMKAKLTERRFSDPGWLFERKLDGVRAIAIKSGGEVRLVSRTGRPLIAYPELTEALGADAAGEFVVDGEIVAFADAQTSFARLQGRMQIQDPEQARRTGIPVFFYLFDLLYFDAHDLRQLPLRKRKSLLRRAIAFADPIRYTSHRNEHGEEYYREACAKGWEGLIAKRAESPYTSRRSGDWLKLKCTHEQELVIGGFTPPQGSRKRFGALLVGYHEDGELRYAGKVGTGFSELALEDLGARLERLRADSSPFTGDGLPREARWVRAELVGQFGFSEWTGDGKLRHPRYLGLRDDKRPFEVRRERPEV